MKPLWQRIRKTLDIFIGQIHGHKLDCCGQIRHSCKRCPFNTEEVQKIVKDHKEKEAKGYITIKGGN